MSSSDEGSGGGGSTSTADQKKYRGVRRRKWGKWVSEIRVPGTQDRLWLGSYSTPEAAAVAHDIASYCLRGPSSLNNLNFPSTLPAGVRTDMSPQSVQKAASDAGMAVDAQFAMNQQHSRSTSTSTDITSRESNVINENDGAIHDHHHFGIWEGISELEQQGEALNISVEDYL